MPEDQQLVLIFGALHVFALIFGGLLLAMFFRSDTVPAWRPPEDDDEGGGGGGEEPPHTPSPPLPSADQSPVRLREPGRLAERHPFPVRRPHRAPQRERERN